MDQLTVSGGWNPERILRQYGHLGDGGGETSGKAKEDDLPRGSDSYSSPWGFSLFPGDVPPDMYDEILQHEVGEEGLGF